MPSADLEDVATRRFFFRPAFAIYGGTAGFYTYGPPGWHPRPSTLNPPPLARPLTPGLDTNPKTQTHLKPRTLNPKNAGAALKANIIAQWKRHFVIEENMMEIEDPTIMPHDVLKTSGHVDR